MANFAARLSSDVRSQFLAWHARYVIWRALGKTLKSQRTLARELGVSQATISYVVRLGGRYKQACPTRPSMGN